MVLLSQGLEILFQGQRFHLSGRVAQVLHVSLSGNFVKKPSVQALNKKQIMVQDTKKGYSTIKYKYKKIIFFNWKKVILKQC